MFLTSSIGIISTLAALGDDVVVFVCGWVHLRFASVGESTSQSEEVRRNPYDQFLGCTYSSIRAI